MMRSTQQQMPPAAAGTPFVGAAGPGVMALVIAGGMLQL